MCFSNEIENFVWELWYRPKYMIADCYLLRYVGPNYQIFIFKMHEVCTLRLAYSSHSQNPYIQKAKQKLRLTNIA